MPFKARTNEEIEAMRSCTCHPSERPVPCQRKFALAECLAAAEGRESSNSEGIKPDPEHLAALALSGALPEAQARPIIEAVLGQSEKPQPSPTWDEVDAIRKGKSDIDLAERIWQLNRELRLLKRAHGDALKEWAYAEGLLRELRSATTAIPADILEAVQSAINSAKAGEFEGWELSLIDRRICSHAYKLRIEDSNKDK